MGWRSAQLRLYNSRWRSVCLLLTRLTSAIPEVLMTCCCLTEHGGLTLSHHHYMMSQHLVIAHRCFKHTNYVMLLDKSWVCFSCNVIFAFAHAMNFPFSNTFLLLFPLSIWTTCQLSAMWVHCPRNLPSIKSPVLTCARLMYGACFLSFAGEWREKRRRVRARLVTA